MARRNLNMCYVCLRKHTEETSSEFIFLYFFDVHYICLSCRRKLEDQDRERTYNLTYSDLLRDYRGKRKREAERKRAYLAGEYRWYNALSFYNDIRTDDAVASLPEKRDADRQARKELVQELKGILHDLSYMPDDPARFGYL